MKYREVIIKVQAFEAKIDVMKFDVPTIINKIIRLTQINYLKKSFDF